MTHLALLWLAPTVALVLLNGWKQYQCLDWMVLTRPQHTHFSPLLCLQTFKMTKPVAVTETFNPYLFHLHVLRTILRQDLIVRGENVSNKRKSLIQSYGLSPCSLVFSFISVHQSLKKSKQVYHIQHIIHPSRNYNRAIHIYSNGPDNLRPCILVFGIDLCPWAWSRHDEKSTQLSI